MFPRIKDEEIDYIAMRPRLSIYREPALRRTSDC
jgi:hypothetical protein